LQIVVHSIRSLTEKTKGVKKLIKIGCT